MSIRDEQRERVVERLSAHLLANGLAQVSLRQLAAAAGVSDRMLLYYFEDKAEVLSASLERLAGQMIVSLARALPDGQVFPLAEFVQRAADVAGRSEMRSFMRLWVEVIAAAARGEMPFAEISNQIIFGFQTWVESRLDLPDGVDRAGVSLAIIALIDGLALIDICVGEQHRGRAARALAFLTSASGNAKPA
ncbi:MAG: TetR/AcrR family transcriptional regulator [Sphingomonadales bacterium]|jgi:AcrR family transcriptional regulator|nr:TetR/AcrR family transcriptional regulator [Sphingomonadales bacterium]MBP7135772.1 TetR/AcrR family transcriptional regulator [Sphingomonadaceae bacterium]MBK6493271.1 TetR/AcrR family transcriptional regulator [Sphingomonadales bacterium]MBK6719855.1 TetR/AcrR family transcriptional regulator [Sphingomonadales bacterium]MBK8861402.1 TetR/AcrR family transcriptional regulator [Sphingomonadales bacterium]